MKKVLLTVLLCSLAVLAYSDEFDSVEVSSATENSISKDYDQDGVYSSYERALRRAQTSIYVTLPEKRGYWYTMLDRIKAEEEELLPDAQARMRKKR